MTRIELIERMITGDLEASHYVIYEDNRSIKCSKCTDLFKNLALFDFTEVDEDIWLTIRDFAFERLTANECEKLKQIREPQSFDSWLRRTVTRLAQREHKEILERYSVTSRPNPDDVIIRVSKSVPPEETDSVSDIGSSILAEIYDARNDTELVQKLISDYKLASIFGSKGQPIYAKILELIFVKKLSPKEIALEMGWGPKAYKSKMSLYKSRAILSLSTFVIKKIKEYEQKTQ
jgi:DNA-directed RNA polymerase specialized sigma24 family protein